MGVPVRLKQRMYSGS